MKHREILQVCQEKDAEKTAGLMKHLLWMCAEISILICF
ncbi:hypothetical protein GTPT_1583 [Tatumella ptyseos ATCC 33301]|uniref:Uncharacterized protein n=2 Tax=Tatumella ptyseos TaxID=82987 RepID=A0A085JI32_9GAMM|nr:hypothetical protein GTPT_1583 [Tatumella ptyseos ATCC 33301]SQK75791.1 Uncharacterised protein [Tatumella ptyseos]